MGYIVAISRWNILQVCRYVQYRYHNIIVLVDYHKQHVSRLHRYCYTVA